MLPMLSILKTPKALNNGKGLWRILRLRGVCIECVASKAFQGIKQFASICEIMLSEGFGVLLWYVCQSMYPMYHLLRLADKIIGGIDRVK